MRRLLVITQVMDEKHPILGFFSRWMRVWAEVCGPIEVIALQVSPSLVVPGVHITSLGKERGVGTLGRLVRLFGAVWRERHHYDDVFVHMNEEYVVVCGWLWKLMGKRVYLWRNHPIGTWKTPIAARFVDTLFYTSPQSYVARYAWSTRMPAGIPLPSIPPIKKREGQIVMAGRIAKWYKRTHLLVDAGISLLKRFPEKDWRVLIVGDPDRGEEAYYQELQRRVQEAGLAKRIQFLPGVGYADVLALYAESDVVINTTQSGSFDKALLEAMAYGCIPVTSNAAFEGVFPPEWLIPEEDSAALDRALERLLLASPDEREGWRNQAREYIEQEQSLLALTERIHNLLV